MGQGWYLLRSDWREPLERRKRCQPCLYALIPCKHFWTLRKFHKAPIAGTPSAGLNLLDPEGPFQYALKERQLLITSLHTSLTSP
jgi:hypothetical protein